MYHLGAALVQAAAVAEHGDIRLHHGVDGLVGLGAARQAHVEGGDVGLARMALQSICDLAEQLPDDRLVLAASSTVS